MSTQAGCSCKGRPGNTGIPAVKPFGPVVGIVRVPLRGADGTRNFLDVNSTTKGQDLLDLINNVDPTKRGYPYRELKNVTHEEADPTEETADNNERFITQRNPKKVTYQAWGVTEQYFNKTQEMCSEEGVYLIDGCGNLKGQLEGDGLYPRPVNKNSYFAMYKDAIPGESPKVEFSFDYKITTNDGNQWMFTASDFDDIDICPTELLGMIDVRFTIISVDSATQVTVEGRFDYGTAGNAIPWQGALPADFTLINKTTPATIVPSAADPVPNFLGRYQLTFAAQTINDLIDVDAFRAASGNGVNGFEGIEAEFTAL